MTASKRNTYYGELAHQINKAVQETNDYSPGHLQRAYWMLQILLEKVKIRPEHAFLLYKKNIFAKLYKLENVSDEQVKATLEEAELVLDVNRLVRNPNLVKQFINFLSEKEKVMK